MKGLRSLPSGQRAHWRRLTLLRKFTLVSLALLAALQGGNILSQTLRDTAPLRASMNAALAYIHTFERPA